MRVNRTAESPQDPRVEYALTVLLGQHYERLRYHGLVNYGEARPPNSPGIDILPSGFFSNEMYGSARSLPEPPLNIVEGIPLLFGHPDVNTNGLRIQTRADVVASAFFLLTRYEEMVRKDTRDCHGRFPGKASLPYRGRFLHRPIVDEYRDLLKKWLTGVGVQLEEPADSFRIVMTHDLDIPFLYPTFRAAGRATVALIGSLSKTFLLPLSAWMGISRDPFDTFDWLISVDTNLREELGDTTAKTVYFVMASSEANPNGSNYETDSPRLLGLLNKLRRSGAELGLHSSRLAGEKPEVIARERNLLERLLKSPVSANRHHFLSLREPQHISDLGKAGIQDDYTLGYHDVAGFRLGTCRPTKMFDPVRMQVVNVTEHPLIVMDCTLDRETYMGLDETQASACCAVLLEATRRHRGELVILWHNTEVVERPGNYHPRLYARLLESAGTGERASKGEDHMPGDWLYAAPDPAIDRSVDLRPDRRIDSETDREESAIHELVPSIQAENRKQIRDSRAEPRHPQRSSSHEET